jgi:hypothetical protein
MIVLSSMAVLPERVYYRPQDLRQTRFIPNDVEKSGAKDILHQSGTDYHRGAPGLTPHLSERNDYGGYLMRTFQICPFFAQVSEPQWYKAAMFFTFLSRFAILYHEGHPPKY